MQTAIEFININTIGEFFDMETLGAVSGILWGNILFPLLFAVCIFLLVGLRFVPWRQFGNALVYLVQSRKIHPGYKGEVSPFNALMLSLAVIIGNKNIVGVAAAIIIGGPGAIFWMWLTALLGMAAKYSETLLAVHFRETAFDGSFLGGPMYYIKNGLSQRWHWLALLFAVAGVLTSVAAVNFAHSYTITQIISLQIPLVPKPLIASLLFLISVIVLLGGIRRIAAVAAILVPVMIIGYVAGGSLILLLNWQKVPGAFAMIFQCAFTGRAAVGGIAGAAVMAIISQGVALAITSNEVGLGTASIVHAAAKTNSPVKQALLAMLDPVFGSLIVCTFSALVILTVGLWDLPAIDSENKAALLISQTFAKDLGSAGGWFMMICAVLFTFTTLTGWCLIGERCAIYLAGHHAGLPFRMLYALVVPIGALANLDIIEVIAGICSFMLMLPNFAALVLLSPVVFKLTREHFKK